MAFKDPIGAHRTAGIPLVGATYRDMHFDGEDAAGVIFKDYVLERVRLTGSSLWQTMFVNSRLDDREFVDCRVFRTQWVNCSGSGFRIVGGEFAEAVISGSKFGRVAVEQSGQRIVLAESEIGRVEFNGRGCAQEGLTVSGCTFDSVAAENATWHGSSTVGVDLLVKYVIP